MIKMNKNGDSFYYRRWRFEMFKNGTTWAHKTFTVQTKIIVWQLWKMDTQEPTF